MATAESFSTAARRVARNQDMRVVVVSAPGKISGMNGSAGRCGCDPVKVTDRLLAIAAKARKCQPIEEEIAALERRFSEIESGLGLPESDRVSMIVKELVLQRARMLADDDAPLAALGEELSAKLFASFLRARGIPAAYVGPEEAGLRVNGAAGEYFIGRDGYPAIRERLNSVLHLGQRAVVPGFFGYDSSGAIRTFARGGSDYTGSVIAAALEAGLYQNFTDTDGLRVVEPSIAEDARVIRTMTHRELTELTLGGAFGVFQYEAAVPIAQGGVPTQVLNTFDEGSRGTYILPQRGNRDDAITGIVHRGEFTAFEIVKYGGANRIGFFADTLKIFTDLGISVEHAPSSTNDISVIVRKKSIEKAGIGIGEVVGHIMQGIGPDDLKIHYLSAVAMVGEAVSGAVGLGRDVFGALAREGLNVPYHSNQGITFVLWLSNGDGMKAAKTLYAELFRQDRRSSQPP